MRLGQLAVVEILRLVHLLLVYVPYHLASFKGREEDPLIVHFGADLACSLVSVDVVPGQVCVLI